MVVFNKSAGFVYFMKCGKFVKIGFSAWPENRLRYVKTGNPFPVEIIAAYPGTLAQEHAIQAHFARLRHQGEWFNVDDELQDVIDNGLSKIRVKTVPSPRATGSMAETLCKFALDAANEFCRATGYSMSTVSIRATGNANFFRNMSKKKCGTFITYDRAINYLIDNWPGGAIWPSTPNWPYRWPRRGEMNGEDQGKPEQAQAREGTQARKGGRARPRA